VGEGVIEGEGVVDKVSTGFGYFCVADYFEWIFNLVGYCQTYATRLVFAVGFDVKFLMHKFMVMRKCRNLSETVGRGLATVLGM